MGPRVSQRFRGKPADLTTEARSTIRFIRAEHQLNEGRNDVNDDNEQNDSMLTIGRRPDRQEGWQKVKQTDHADGHQMKSLTGGKTDSLKSTRLNGQLDGWQRNE